MKGKFVIALEDNQGHLYMIYTDVESDEDYKKVASKMSEWSPRLTASKQCTDYLSREEIFNSLKKLTGHSFQMYQPDFFRSYSSIGIALPSAF